MAKELITITEEDVFNLASQGFTKAIVAQELGVSRQTLHTRMKNNPLLYDAYKKGQARDVQDVVNVLKASAIKGNVTAMIFYLKNKDPERWRDQHDMVVSGGMTINVGVMNKDASFVNKAAVERVINDDGKA